MKYDEFLLAKTKRLRPSGFKPVWLPDWLFGFQGHLIDWSLRLGRAAILADCGLGKGPMQLVWAENIVRHGQKRKALIVAPLAVAQQFVAEAAKFGVEIRRSLDGTARQGITVTNYERLARFDPDDFDGVSADEGSILKNFDGKTRRVVTDFMARVCYRLVCTATPAPNDFMELGSTSEAVGVMPRNQMLGTFFTNGRESTQEWRLKGHARQRFWQWVASWARACRRPSDLGYPDDGFVLPPLTVERYVLPGDKAKSRIFPWVARTLHEQRAERRRSLAARCEKVVEVLPEDRPAVIWCHLNEEGKLLAKEIPGAVEVAGCMADEEKEARLTDFSAGKIRVLVTKPRIGGFGLNWQHCSTVAYFPGHSHEQYYQAVRRCWRFGQKQPVRVHLVMTEAEALVAQNMLRKERQAEELYAGIVREMNQALAREQESAQAKVRFPAWL